MSIPRFEKEKKYILGRASEARITPSRHHVSGPKTGRRRLLGRRRRRRRLPVDELHAGTRDARVLRAYADVRARGCGPRAGARGPQANVSTRGCQATCEIESSCKKAMVANDAGGTRWTASLEPERWGIAP
ncbi:hypothetical protein GGX14DRAFT_391887 [Mycena pura]|uniref:Uncharacterized protein n=1 Tax=Mycena pura TaxID=153505 RepID=A0AAD6VL61_9AGAR|nr:hypothetical protein GGX14DRAFT_391887 [Mycena pura]